ncbi:MAG: hypothetical protein L0215_24390 [Gemmataceae bacterium]|nr:hypothetical protein [Gemmataceae bacterium]
MQPSRKLLALLVLAVGVLGACFGVLGQEARPPWPPAPVVPPDHYEESAPLALANVNAPVPLPLPPQGRGEVSAPAPKQVTPMAQSPAPPPLAQQKKGEMRIEPKRPQIEDSPAPFPSPPLPPPMKDEPPLPSLPLPDLPSIPNPALPMVKETDAGALPPPMATPNVPLPLPETQAPLPDLPVLPPTPPVPEVSKPLPLPPKVAPPEVKPPPPALIEPPVAPVGKGIAGGTPSAEQSALTNKPPAFRIVVPIQRAAPTPLPDLFSPEKPLAHSNPVALGPGFQGAVTPQVTLEKRGPAQYRSGEPLRYVLVVRNVGATPAMQVRVEDELPPGARLLAADPKPAAQNERVLWILPELAPGAEKQLRVELMLQGGGEFQATSTVTVFASLGSRAHVAQESLSVSVTGPETALAGFPAVFEILVANNSKRPLSGLALQAKLPPGLSHPQGNHIEADIGELAAGQSKAFKMPTTALQPGRQTVEVRVSAAGGLEATGQGTVQVNMGAGPSVQIKQPEQVRVFLHKESELCIAVSNRSPKPMRNITVSDVLPEGVEFVSASDRGIYRQESRTAHWLIDQLAPGQTKVLVAKVQGKALGKFHNEVSARTEAREESKSSGVVQVNGLTDLALQVTERNGPIEVGQSAVYEIKVSNQGSVPATGVVVEASLPEGIVPSKVQGPSSHRIDGRHVTFAALPRLAAHGSALFYVTALAQSPGHGRFRAQVSSDQAPTPNFREALTFVYRD